MKLLRNKFTETVILLPIITFFAVSAYYLYTSYTNYSSANKSLAYSNYIGHLNAVLTEQNEEQGLVSIFLGAYGTTDYKQLEQQWQRSDRAIKALDDFVLDNPQHARSGQPILNALYEMRDARSRISVLNIRYDDLYIDNHESKPNKLLIKSMRAIDLASVNENTAARLRTFAEIGALKESSGAERNFIAYLLSRSIPIHEDELEAWDRMIGQDKIPDYKGLSPNTLVLQLDELLRSEEYKTIGTKVSPERIAILTSYNSGKFSTDVTVWYDLYSNKLALLEKAQNIVFDIVQTDTKERIAAEQKTMAVSATVLVLALLMAVVVRNIFSGMARDTEQLEEVLKNIDFDSDEEDDYDLKLMVARQNKAEIYQLLERTIRESKESKLLADEANETKSKFLANMSHEIRTPLNGIVGFTGLLKTTDLDVEQQEFIDIIEKSSENLLAVINDILDLSKIESDKIDIEDVAFDPIDEFESGIESYGAKASEKGIDLGFYIDPSLSNQLKGDPTRIKQVIVNLISNAVKFTDKGGEIDVLIERIASENNNTTVRFSVKDSGIGISTEQKTKIFEAFSQADTSTNRKFGGTGLGLTISRTLVELMGGSLDLESVEGEGTTFFFELTLEEIPLLTEPELFDNLSVGYYQPTQRKIKRADSYIKTYIKTLNDGYYVYDTIASLLSLGKDQQPDLLFVDYDHVSDEDLAQLCTLKSKISLLTTVHKKDHVGTLDLDLYKVIYSPINFTKIKKPIATLSNAEKKVTQESVEEKFHNLNALVAEDNMINQKLIKRSLENIGITVTLANNGEEAFKLRTRNSYDVIFMDIQMPVMNGIEATHAILDYEKENNSVHVPIIALTANALKGDKERFLAEGMDQYVSKPMELEVIKNILRYYFHDKLATQQPAVKKEEAVAEVIPQEKTQKSRPSPERKQLKTVDILLCKHTPTETNIFNVLLQKIGYSVDKAKDLEELKAMIQAKNYRYVLLDKELDGLQESNLPETLKELSIPSLLFVQNLQSVIPNDRYSYSRVALNVANIQLLRHVMVKLIPLECDEFQA
ncbi:MAG: ATP-binding protein [Campylobacterota bacterium]